jgi:hypothetical protein
MLEGLEAFVGGEYLSRQDILSLRTAHRAAIFSFSGHVDSIVDALGFTEAELNSVFALKDKTPYQALWEIAQHSELSDNRFIRPTLLNARNLWKKYQGHQAKI